MRLRRLVGVATAAAIVAVIAFSVGCNPSDKPVKDDNGTPPEVEEKPLEARIGVILPLSGKNELTGKAILAGLEFAFKTRGKALGLDSPETILKRDYSDCPADSVGPAKDLVEFEGVHVLVGPADASGVEVIEELARQREVVVLTTATGNIKRSIIGSTVWRMTFSDEQEGRMMAERAASRELAVPAVVVDTSMRRSEARASAFAKKFGEITGAEPQLISYSSGQTNFRRLMRKIISKNADVVYLSGGGDESAAIVAEMVKQNVHARILGSTDWDTTKDFPVEVGMGASVFVPSRFPLDRRDITAMEFVKKFETATGTKPSAMVALGYDCGLVIIEVLARAGGDRKKIAENTSSITAYSGVTGQLSARSGSLATEMSIMRLKGKKFIFVETAELR